MPARVTGTFRLAPPLVATILVFSALIAGVVSVRAGLPNRLAGWRGLDWYANPTRDYAEVRQRIGSLPDSPRLAARELGRVFHRGSSHALHALCFSTADGSTEPRRVLLVGGTHGNEPAGTEALLRFAEELARRPALFPNVAIDIIPLVNPWGWVYDSRYDPAGEDINRDFASTRTAEAALVRGFAGERGGYDLVMDLHESKKSGYFIYQYLPREKGMGTLFVDIVMRRSKYLEDSYREWWFKASGGILAIPVSVLPLLRIAGRLSFEHWMRLSGSRHAYTVETPVEAPWADRVEIHVETVKSFIRALPKGRA